MEKPAYIYKQIYDLIPQYGATLTEIVDMAANANLPSTLGTVLHANALSAHLRNMAGRKDEFRIYKTRRGVWRRASDLKNETDASVFTARKDLEGEIVSIGLGITDFQHLCSLVPSIGPFQKDAIVKAAEAQLAAIQVELDVLAEECKERVANAPPLEI